MHSSSVLSSHLVLPFLSLLWTLASKTDHTNKPCSRIIRTVDCVKILSLFCSFFTFTGEIQKWISSPFSDDLRRRSRLSWRTNSMPFSKVRRTPSPHYPNLPLPSPPSPHRRLLHQQLLGHHLLAGYQVPFP